MVNSKIKFIYLFTLHDMLWCSLPYFFHCAASFVQQIHSAGSQHWRHHLIPIDRCEGMSSIEAGYLDCSIYAICFLEQILNDEKIHVSPVDIAFLQLECAIRIFANLIYRNWHVKKESTSIGCEDATSHITIEDVYACKSNKTPLTDSFTSTRHRYHRGYYRGATLTTVSWRHTSTN